jgi:hypothetical protein
MSRAGLWATDPAQAYRAVAGALCSAGPALLFGLRLGTAVCVALYIAFWLELDNAYWAGTSAAIVCQPRLGASLRKGSFRRIGTVLGAVVIVVLTACFPQSRIGFLIGLAVWGAICGFIATLLRNFASYAPRRSAMAPRSTMPARTRTESLAKEGWTSTDIYQQTTSTLHQSEEVVALNKAAIAKAELDLRRTVIRSPVNGYVTNLLAQLGDYATVGQKLISVVDADSFWVDGYFEETSLGRIHEGDPATVKLMGHSQLVRGHVGGVARGINTPNAQPDQTGLASVNPIFTWVRLAQRVPVRIHIDQVPAGVRLVAGMTATVQIDPQPRPLGSWYLSPLRQGAMILAGPDPAVGRKKTGFGITERPCR